VSGELDEILRIFCVVFQFSILVWVMALAGVKNPYRMYKRSSSPSVKDTGVRTSMESLGPPESVAKETGPALGDVGCTLMDTLEAGSAEDWGEEVDVWGSVTSTLKAGGTGNWGGGCRYRVGFRHMHVGG